VCLFPAEAMATAVVHALRESPASVVQPPGALQTLIDDASPGAELTVPPGLYRETVTISKPLILHGAGAEIRGADPWTDWRPVGARWVSEATVPAFEVKEWPCASPRCRWPEQAFLDETPLVQVEDSPGTGEFALDADRHVVLGDDPTDRLVEVSTRTEWVVVDSPDVTLDGFVMRDAATPAQFGAIQAQEGADRLTVHDVTLSDAHGALISFQGIKDGSLVDSDLRRGGQLGIHSGGSGTDGLVIIGNTVRDNNTEGFEPGWEAGGMKLVRAVGARVADNDVEANDGHGIWCDIDCRNVVIEGNRVKANSRTGIIFEISDTARIEGNDVFENGWGDPTWGWGAGILISSSTRTTVEGNVLAWNADGITVVSQERHREIGDTVHDVVVRDNTILTDAAGGFMLAWLTDWDDSIFDPASANMGTDNRFWHDLPEPTKCRFEWKSCQDDLAAFTATPGGAGSDYLTRAARDSILGEDEIPTPSLHPVGEPPTRRELLTIAAAVGGGLLVVTAIGGLAVRRRRQRIRDRRRSAA
jgi:parallel beta-helix repeat protein